MLAELLRLTRADLVAFFNTKLCPSGAERRKLCVKIVSSAHHGKRASAHHAASGAHHHAPPPHTARVVEIADITMTQATLPRLPGYFSPPVVSADSA